MPFVAGDLVRYRLVPEQGGDGHVAEEQQTYWRCKNHKAMVTEVEGNQATITMQEGVKKGKTFLVLEAELSLWKDEAAPAAVPRGSDRRGANMGKLSRILSGLLQQGAAFNAIFERWKDANLNDNHLHGFTDSSRHDELEILLGSKILAERFRLAVIDATAAGTVSKPTAGSDADYAAAAEWVLEQPKNYGASKKAKEDWLTFRHVELDTNRLRRAIEAVKRERSEAPTPQKPGPNPKISDMIFLKYVVTTMQSGGTLKYNLDDWTAVLRAVYMLSQGIISSKDEDKDNDDIIQAVWRGDIYGIGLPKNIWPPDAHSASAYLARFDINTRQGEVISSHRLGVNPAAVEDVFNTLKDRLELFNVTKVTNVLVTDELRFKKEWERMKAAMLAVCESEEARSCVQGLGNLMDGCTMTPVNDLLGTTHLVQVICEDKESANRVNASVVNKIMRDAGFTCRICVSYSRTGYQTGETNKHMKEELILALGSTFEGWQAGQPLPEAFILIEDGASMHAQDLNFTLTCITSGLITHHVAPNSTHFAQLFDRHNFRVTKMLCVKELTIRVQAMHSKRPDSVVEKTTWTLRILGKCTLAMEGFKQSESLEERRAEFAADLFSGGDEAQHTLSAKMNGIFDIAERKKTDELLLIHAMAPALFIGLQARYTVPSAVMVGLLPPDYKCGDPVPAAGVWPEKVLQHPLVRLARKRQENIDHFEAHQGDAIKTVLDQMGYRSHAQALSACPALSDAGTPAAFAALDPQIVQGYMTSRGIDEAHHEFLRTLLGDFELYQRRIGREQKRQQNFDDLQVLNTSTAASVQAAIVSEQVQDTEAALKDIETCTSRAAAQLKISAAQFTLGVKRVKQMEEKTYGVGQSPCKLVACEADDARNSGLHDANFKSIHLAIHNFENCSDARFAAENYVSKAHQYRLRPNPEDARLSAALASIETIDAALEAADDDTRELDNHLIALSSLAFTLSDAEFGGRRGIAEIVGMLDDIDGALCQNKYGAPQGGA